MKRTAFVAAVVAAMLWGGNFVAVRVALEHLDPYLLTALRFAFVAAVIPFVGWPRVPLPTLLFYAACSGIGQYMLSTMAIQMGLSPGLAALLMQFQVFFSLVLSWLVLKESVTAATVIGSVLGVAGLTGVLLTGGTKAPVLASAVCLLAAIGWAAANMTIKRFPESVIRLQGASGLICLPIVWAARELLMPAAQPVGQILTQMPLTGWLSVAYVVIASFALAQMLWGFAIGTNGVAASSPFALLIPLFGMALAWLILGETLSNQLLLSATLVVVGVAAHIVPLAVPDIFSRKLRRG
jgi:O-acetylserine/cysteine efflux transporter